MLGERRQGRRETLPLLGKGDREKGDFTLARERRQGRRETLPLLGKGDREKGDFTFARSSSAVRDPVHLKNVAVISDSVMSLCRVTLMPYQLYKRERGSNVNCLIICR